MSMECAVEIKNLNDQNKIQLKKELVNMASNLMFIGKQHWSITCLKKQNKLLLITDTKKWLFKPSFVDQEFSQTEWD